MVLSGHGPRALGQWEGGGGGEGGREGGREGVGAYMSSVLRGNGVLGPLSVQKRLVTRKGGDGSFTRSVNMDATHLTKATHANSS